MKRFARRLIFIVVLTGVLGIAGVIGASEFLQVLRGPLDPVFNSTSAIEQEATYDLHAVEQEMKAAEVRGTSIPPADRLALDSAKMAQASLGYAYLGYYVAVESPWV